MGWFSGGEGVSGGPLGAGQGAILCSRGRRRRPMRLQYQLWRQWLRFETSMHWWNNFLKLGKLWGMIEQHGGVPLGEELTGR